MDPIHKWFDTIYLKYQKRLLLIAVRMVRNPQLAEDIVQSVFLTLLVNYESLVKHPNIWGWLITTLKNQMMSEMQKAFHSREVALDPDLDTISEDPFEPGFSAAMPPGLSDDERKVLYLYYEVGLHHDEIAAQFGCSVAASRMRLFRAREHCRELISKNAD